MSQIKSILILAGKHKVLTTIIILMKLSFNILLFKLILIITNKNISEAKGRRIEGRTIYKRCLVAMERHLQDYGRRKGRSNILSSAKRKAKKIGFKGEYIEIKYLFVKYGITILIFIITLASNFPSIREAFMASVVVFCVNYYILRKKEKEIGLTLQKHVYKIYKYLHNQIVSGLIVSNAIKNVHEVIEDIKLKEALIRMSGRYELTMNIDAALDEFRTVYDTHEAESFCIAIKQGILTGDNSDLLARQEDIMFKKYFNYIQSETDSYKTKSLIAAVLFISIIVIMILIPMIFEAAGALEGIFTV